MFVIGLKIRLDYILRSINANVLKPLFLRFLRKFYIIYNHYIGLAL